MCWNVKYIFLLLGSVITTYLCAILIEKYKYKKLFLSLCIVINIGILFIFKYYNLFTNSFVWIAEKLLHTQLIPPSSSLLLPVGISFYTFQALSYSIDVYRGTVEPEKSIFKYALFVSFFPQLVAGPIERSENLLHQFDEVHIFDPEKAKHGLELMLWGYFEKLVIADRMAIFVNQIYSHYEGYGFYEILLATFGFTFQLYCDFSGYSHIAIGAAEVLGFSLCDNFRQPLFATSISDLWRRWHISLSTWFKDYIYIPLGGSKRGKWRKYINLLITFTLSGLWHGASWSYVVWGGLHGIYQITGDLIKNRRKKLEDFLNISRDCLSYRVFSIITTFLLFSFSLIFFRASTSKDAINIIRQMKSTYNPWVLFDQSLYNCGLDRINVLILLAAILILLIVDVLHERKYKIRDFIDRQNTPARLLIYYLAVMIILVFGVYGSKFDINKFIYFQF